MRMYFKTNPLMPVHNLIMGIRMYMKGRIGLSVDKSARSLIHQGKVDDGVLNMIEMAFRACDPCHGCATHSLVGEMPVEILVRSSTDGQIIRTFTRGR
jgi:F420-non-reducing hydrogenase large subunit